MVALVGNRKPGRRPKPRVFDGAKLRELRGEITQAELAKLVGVHESDVGKYERGEADPSLHTLVQLAKVLEVDASEFLKDE